MPIKLDGFTPEALADLEALGAHMGKEDQTVFENLLQKNPKAAREIIDGRLRQSDYDKNMNRSKAEVEAAKKRAEEMQEWYDRNEPLHKQALSTLSTLEQEKAALEEKYKKQSEEFAALAASKGGEGVDAEALQKAIDARVAQLGYVTQEEFNKIKSDELMNQVNKAADDKIKAAETKLFTETMPALWNSAMDLAEITTDHKAEFGEKLNRQEFSKFMTENSITDTNKGYNAFVAERRAEVKFKQRVEEEVKQRLSGMQVNGDGSHGSNSFPQLMERGVLQQKVDAENKATGNAATSAAAMEAAAELRSEGKF